MWHGIITYQSSGGLKGGGKVNKIDKHLSMYSIYISIFEGGEAKKSKKNLAI